MKKLATIMLFLILALLSACGQDENADESDEVKMLNVDFPVPESAQVGETVELKAIVTYGNEKEKNADEVKFEYWKRDNKDNSTTVEATNNGDGTYTAEVSFDDEGVYEMYAHVTADGLHTMPLKSITVGDAE